MNSAVYERNDHFFSSISNPIGKLMAIKCHQSNT